MRGWTGGPDFRNGRRYYDIGSRLGPAYGDPLFFAHYSFLGIDPRGLRNRYADYWAQNLAHVRINEAHCRQKRPKSLHRLRTKLLGIDRERQRDRVRRASIRSTIAVRSRRPRPCLVFRIGRKQRCGRCGDVRFALGHGIWGRYG